MKKKRLRFGKILPAGMRIPVILALSVNMIAYYGTRAVSKKRHHYDITTALDKKIPVLPWTILIYWGCYIYWVINYVIGARQEKNKAFRFFAADFLAKIGCMVCFLVFPTTNVRPVLSGKGIFVRLMNALYKVDAADNLFPSIHCLTSWFCFIAVRKNSGVSMFYRIFSLIFTIMICISTLTTRQHVLADVAGGILLAEGSYYLVNKTKFCIRYKEWVEKIETFLHKKD